MKLTHKQEIRVAGFSIYAGRITVGTIEGTTTPEMLPEAIERAKANRWDLAWALQESPMLTSDYPGKAEETERRAAATAAAPEVADGDIVEIEGRTYKVRVMGRRYCDPIHFVPVVTA